MVSASGQGLKSVNNSTVIRAIQFLTADMGRGDRLVAPTG